VGGFAVEAARARGARVIGFGRDRDRAVIEGLGAERALTAPDTLVSDVLALTDEAGADVVIDAARLGAPAELTTRPGGTIVRLRGADDAPAPPGRRVTSISVLLDLDDGSPLRRAIALADAGVLKPWIAAVLPLDRVVDAHAHRRPGGDGRVVLSVPD
jgi:NADPH:quinone reductase-like Zn-dependent oxidoreductase